MYLMGETSTALKVLVDILGIAGILIFGTFVLVFLVDLILSGVDGHKGIFFNRKSPDETYNPVKDEPVEDGGVMYYQNENPNKEPEPEPQPSNEEPVSGVDFDKAIEEQKQLMAQQNAMPMWDEEDDEDEDDISGIIDEVSKEALASLEAEKAPKSRKVYKMKMPEIVEEEPVVEPEPIILETPIFAEEPVVEEPVVDEEKLALERKVAELEEQRRQDREELLQALQELKDKEPVIVEKEDNDKKYANIARMNARLNSIKKTSAKLKEKKEEQKTIVPAPAEEVVTTVVEETVVHEPIETPVVTAPVVTEPIKEIVVEEKVVETKSEKPRFKKEYYENRLATLESDLKEAQKELKANNKEYMPIVKIKKAYDKDSEKLRRKEAQVAKQKVAIYGVNKTGKINEEKRRKLEENVQLLKELKDSVYNCEQVIEKNKDRFPILEKNHKLITKQVKRLQDDISSVKEALKWYDENENK